MDEVAALLARMRELEPHVYVYGPTAEDTIRQLEAAFGHPMPPSYRAFLARWGAVLYQDRWRDDDGAGTRKKKAASKTKYACPVCGLNAWAKPDVRLTCTDCEEELEAEEA